MPSAFSALARRHASASISPKLNQRPSKTSAGLLPKRSAATLVTCARFFSISLCLGWSGGPRSPIMPGARGPAQSRDGAVRRVPAPTRHAERRPLGRQRSISRRCGTAPKHIASNEHGGERCFAAKGAAQHDGLLERALLIDGAPGGTLGLCTNNQ